MKENVEGGFNSPVVIEVKKCNLGGEMQKER